MDKSEVGTLKNRVSTYISDTLKEEIEAYAESHAITVSVAIAELIEKVIVEKGRIIQVNDDDWSKIKEIAKLERRTPEQQTSILIERSLKSN